MDEIELDHADHTAKEQALFDEHIVAYRLDGPLFFGVAHSAATAAGNDGCNRHDV